MSGEGPQQPDEDPKMSSPANLAHVSDPTISVQRGLAKDGPPLRLCVSGTVVKGFGRGSKLLGIPTANMNMKEVGEAVRDTRTGIYFGYTMLKGTVYPAVVSVGWNPYFDNEEKTVEPHLLHTFEDDFYGEKLYLLLCGFIRNELNFKSLDDLIVAIKGDIDYAKSRFLEPEIVSLATGHPFWEEVAGSDWAVATATSGFGSGRAAASGADASKANGAGDVKTENNGPKTNDAEDEGGEVSNKEAKRTEVSNKEAKREEVSNKEAKRAEVSNKEAKRAEVSGGEDKGAEVKRRKDGGPGTEKAGTTEFGAEKTETDKPETVKPERDKPEPNTQGTG